MPRLLGVEIPANKKVAYSLRYINGIGPSRADQIVKEAGLNPDMRSNDLDEEQLNKVLQVITEHKWLLEGDLRRDLRQPEASSGNQLLPRHPSSPWIAGAWSTHQHQRPHPQGLPQNRGCDQSC
jgi:hypothetical protein